MQAAQPSKKRATRRKGKTAPWALALDAVLECSEDALVCLDEKGTIVGWNRGAAAVYGYTQEEILGHSIEVLAPAGRVHEERSILSAILTGQRVQHLETVRLRKNGVAIEVAISVWPIRRVDQIVGACHVARNISERKRLEAANAQLAAIIESSEDAIIS